MAEVESLIAIPCSGNRKLGNERDHLYLLSSTTSEEIVGFASPSEVELLLERGHINSRIEGSHSICPPCASEGRYNTLEEMALAYGKPWDRWTKLYKQYIER